MVDKMRREHWDFHSGDLCDLNGGIMDNARGEYS